MSINATQSHSGEHLVAKKAVCNPEICLEKKKKIMVTTSDFQSVRLGSSDLLVLLSCN